MNHSINNHTGSKNRRLKIISFPPEFEMKFHIYFALLLLIRWWIQRILTPTFSFLLLLHLLLRRFFLNFAFGLLPNGMNDINVRYVRKMSEKCQKCQWVYTSVRVCTSVRCFAQLCPGVSKWAYMCACLCGMNFQNTFWRLDS